MYDANSCKFVNGYSLFDTNDINDYVETTDSPRTEVIKVDDDNIEEKLDALGISGELKKKLKLDLDDECTGKYLKESEYSSDHVKGSLVCSQFSKTEQLKIDQIDSNIISENLEEKIEKTKIFLYYLFFWLIINLMFAFGH